MNARQTEGRIRAYKMCEDLRASKLTRKQNFTSIALGDGKRIKTYCALGAIGCEKKIVGYGTSKAEKYNVGIQVPLYSIIINAYGISDDLQFAACTMYHIKGKASGGKVFYRSKSISDIIPALNDYGHWNFEEIADYIEQLADAGAIVPCSKKLLKDTERYLLEDIPN